MLPHKQPAAASRSPRTSGGAPRFPRRFKNKRTGLVGMRLAQLCVVFSFGCYWQANVLQ